MAKVGITLLLCLGPIASAADWKYLDARNPQGIPDIAQGDGKAVCGSAAMANVLWLWSDRGIYNKPQTALFPRTNHANYKEEWVKDAAKVQLRLADFMYGKEEKTTVTENGQQVEKMVRRENFGVFGVDKYLQERKLWAGKPAADKLTIRSTASISWQSVKKAVDDKNPMYISWEWTTPAGTRIEDRAAHAMVLSGYREVDGKREIAVTNGWGNHNEQAEKPVDSAYYDVLRVTSPVSDDRLIARRDDTAGLANNTVLAKLDGRADAYTSYRGNYLVTGAAPIAQARPKGGRGPSSPGGEEFALEVTNLGDLGAGTSVAFTFEAGSVDLAEALSSAGEALTSDHPEWTVRLLDVNGADRALADLGGMAESDIAGELLTYEFAVQGLVFESLSAPILNGAAPTAFRIGGFLSPEVRGSFALGTAGFQDYYVGSIEAVPEASTLAVFGGLLALARKRRG